MMKKHDRVRESRTVCFEIVNPENSRAWKAIYGFGTLPAVRVRYTLENKKKIYVADDISHVVAIKKNLHVGILAFSFFQPLF